MRFATLRTCSLKCCSSNGNYFFVIVKLNFLRIFLLKYIGTFILWVKMPQKNVARSVQPFWYLLDMQTNRKKRSNKGKWAHFPSNDTNIFETIFLRFCMKVRLMINSWNAFSKCNKKYNNIFSAFFAVF